MNACIFLGTHTPQTPRYRPPQSEQKDPTLWQRRQHQKSVPNYRTRPAAFHTFRRRSGSLTNIVDVSAGKRHALAVDADGIVYVWSSNAAGVCGAVPYRLRGPPGFPRRPTAMTTMAESWRGMIRSTHVRCRWGRYTVPQLICWDAYTRLLVGVSVVVWETETCPVPSLGSGRGGRHEEVTDFVVGFLG